ncbi:hypothetical protein HYG87_04320 [Methanobacterium alkalithermotolerans]|uniref:Uncharacterized protein n=1 Tax=Methanobacterium alkalithermotolerans TaxID=2731220 RepID=A0A8T8K4Y7_9EURY|nr:hypothetical protein [Methanobacterium alkalithermotolerans]QUH23047.1 hypothetical protein HYG87_04320 [Methanobacterium alkalithermotolerans]
MFIAQNNLQLILEVAFIIHIVVLLLFNIIALPLSMVLFLGIVLTVLIGSLLLVDVAFLFLPLLSHHEFTHPFGSLAVFAWVTIAAAANLLTEVGIKSTSIKTLTIILFFIIAVAGGLMHRSFLILWFLGWALGYLIMSKSFKRSTNITSKSIIGWTLAGGLGFVIMELLSRFLDKPIISPLLRVSRIEHYSISSLKMVIQNTTLWGHVQGSCYWGVECLGGADGYITLPMSLIQSFGLPYHLFYGVLVNRKDEIDYMLPGIFAVAFDAGYAGIIFLLTWIMIVSCTGFYVLRKYRSKRKSGSKMYLGKEALLIGALSAFLAQSIIGLFIFNRSFNGSAMLAYIVLSALVMAHIATLKRSI